MCGDFTLLGRNLRPELADFSLAAASCVDASVAVSASAVAIVWAVSALALSALSVVAWPVRLVTRLFASLSLRLASGTA